VEDSKGFLFGTTFGGGDYDAGVIYRISDDGIFKKVLSFTGGADGGNSRAPLMLGLDGNLYGSNTSGGAYGCGTVFRVTTGGRLTTMASIPCGYADGPTGALTEGSDGSLYGMLGFGGYGSCTSGCGGIFRVTPDGTLTILVTFDDKTNGANASFMSLIDGLDGYFYGMTTGDGTGADTGTAFRMAPDGTLTTLVNFTNMPYGSPGSSFIPAPNNAFYGSLNSGGDNFFGELFMMTKAGNITPLVSYTSATGSPTGPMVMGKDGKIYFSSSYVGGVLARISLP
jgi:uncharacterized repeat protein (TIGR03803 family)